MSSNQIRRKREKSKEKVQCLECGDCISDFCKSFCNLHHEEICDDDCDMPSLNVCKECDENLDSHCPVYCTSNHTPMCTGSCCYSDDEM